ncbi:TRAP transporter small permease subunit [Salinisphaera sp. SPP-AMP-43]|uniref:TRAP transporter small permease n=1 Tax=Salinisphaera sp. SPP-AMP-43 TaxID=3121288 RepID=UPI003C6E9FD5
MPSKRPHHGTTATPRRSVLASAAALFGWVGRAAGIFAAAITLILTASVLLGIVLRAIAIDNSWTYDLDNFALIWLAFLGAAYTGYRGAHVTSGISLEHLLGRGAIMLVVVRFVIVAGFLGVFIYSGYQQFHSSWMFNEKTLDIVQWPVWVAKLALPVGGIAWLAAEIHKLLALLGGQRPTSAEPAD